MLAAGALLGLTAVAAGAFGAHALRPHLTVDRMAVFETAARYQFYHALGLCVIAVLYLQRGPARLLSWAAGLFALGSVVFCGSLYALSLSGWRTLGAITPLGGLCFMGGWLLMAIAAWRWRAPSA
jgi:uncharacterized membrane protein YgdD (TMEM256/DUF423 family)